MEVKITLFNLVLLIANVVILILTIKWRMKEKSTETLIAVIAAIINSITIIANTYNEEEQDKKLADLFNKQIATLNKEIDSLNNNNYQLTAKNMALNSRINEQVDSSVSSGSIVGDSNTVSNPAIKGNNNSVITSQNSGSNNTIIMGNDRSRIVINEQEKPILSKRLIVGELVKTDILIHPGDKVLVTATGSMRLGPNVGYFGPEGKQSGGVFGLPLEGYNLIREYPHGSLMQKNSNNHTWLNCGKEYNFTADSEGYLEFDVNDNQRFDNIGGYQVEVKIFK